MAAIPLTFSLSGLTAAAKLLYFGAAGTLPTDLATEVRSLKIEHVSPVTLVHQEICRGSPLGQQAALAHQRGVAVSDQTLLAVLRKWFWTRKPDAGFLLAGFPATLLHAHVFDEWLEARAETLTGCLCAGPTAPAAPARADATNPAVIEHYRTLGLLMEPALALV